MKPFRLTALILLLVPVVSCFAADKRSAGELSAEERQAAYNVAVNQISTKLKAPSTAHYAAIEEAIFSTGIKNSIDVRLNVDAQNSFGAMLRNAWWCRVFPQRADSLYPVSCFEISMRIPKDAVRGLPLSSEPGGTVLYRATGAKPEVALISIAVQSSPSEAYVEVDGYPAGKTPVGVKLAKGEYTLKVSKPGFQAWSQKITVEPGKAQSLGIALAVATK